MVDNFVTKLRESILPECFQLDHTTVAFQSYDEICSVVDDPGRFMDFALTHTRVEPGAYVDSYKSGFTGSLALALWFMQFDEDNWFSFSDTHRKTAELLSSRRFLKERIELRLIKGRYPPMMLDQPVLIDYLNLTVSFLSGELKD